MFSIQSPQPGFFDDKQAIGVQPKTKKLVDGWMDIMGEEEVKIFKISPTEKKTPS